MKLMIVSDIHGSAYYCEKMLECYKKENADKLVILGDVLYHGPRNDLPEEYAPKKVIEMLNNIKEEILCVRGNCDTEVDQMVLKFPIMADYALLYWKNRMIFVTHGHNHNLEKMPMLKKGDILLHGHTHIPVCEKAGEIYYINPGSISIPKQNSEHSYIILDDEGITFKNLDTKAYGYYSEKDLI